MKKTWRRYLSSALACAMLFSLMPAGAFAADAEAGEDSSEALSSISAGTGELEDYLENQEDGEAEGTYDYVWYGGLKWRVLETEYEADEGTGTLLLSEYVLNYGQAWDGIRTYSSRGGTSDGDTDYGYIYSDIRAYLTGEGDYTSFITARTIAADELDHSSVEFYYYRVEVDDSQLASGAEEGTVYYTYDSEGAVYVEETSADLTSLTFPYGQYFVLNEDGSYTEADTYDAEETYYYDASSYVVADVSDGFDADTEYFTFCKVSGSLDYTEFSPAVFGTRYYAGYSTTGSGIPADDSSSTWTIVSGMSAEDISFATEYGFTQAELEAVLTVSADADNARSGIFTYYGGALEGDTYFLLSASESGNADYGLETAADRAATFLDGSTEASWWLRTSFYSSSPAIVEETGYLNATFASDDCVGIRPAFVLDPDSVFFLSSAEGGKELASASESVSGFVSLAEEDTSEYIMTLVDDSLSVSVTDADGEDGVYTFSYSDASTWGDNVYLSAILTDESGETIYGYARLANIDSEDSTSGTVSFELPATAIVDGEEVELDAAGCTLQVFLEVCSTTGATEDSCGTDYASEPTEVSLDGTGTEAQSTPTVSFESDSVSVTIGGTVENPLTVEPGDLEVTYESSDESVATVDAEGNVTIVGEGTTVITATTTETEEYASASDSYTLTVSGVAGPAVGFAYDTVYVNMGSSVENPLAVEPEDLEVTYTSSDESVATVDEDGNVTLVGEGTAVITATTTATDDYESVSDSYTLIVSSVVIEYSASGCTTEYDGEEHTITVDVDSPENAVVTYGTSADDISLTEAPAYIEPGTYTVYYQITAEGYETVTGSADVVIAEAEAEIPSVSFEYDTVNVNLGGSVENPLTVEPEGLEVTYTSSDESVATVDEDGNVTLVGEGTAVITAATTATDDYESASDSYTLNVAEGGIEYSVSGYEGGYDGEEHTIKVEVESPEDAVITYGTSADDISLTEAPAYVEPGTYTVYYQITAEGYETVTGSAEVVIAEAEAETPSVSFKYDTVDVNLGGSVENPLTVEPEGLEVTYSSSDESVATVDEDGNVTIVGEGTAVITAATTATDDYESASDSYTLTVSGVAIEYSVSGYVGEYDGEEHTISLEVESPEDAVVTYGISEDDISLTEAPAYIEPGTYTVYYQITADGYETVTGSADIVITEEEQEEESEDVSGCPRDETCPIYPYTDTLRTNWYHDAVHYVIENGIMIGTSSTTWEPESATTRGMIVTILYRMEGSPEVEGTSSFSDVEEGSWYEDAVIWAESEGIVLGYGNGLYGPSDTLTREQYAVILYRYSLYKGYDIELADISSFPDADEVSDWAVDGMAWAVSASVISGTVYGNVTELSPTDDCIRAMAAQITYNYINYFMN